MLPAKLHDGESRGCHNLAMNVRKWAKNANYLSCAVIVALLAPACTHAHSLLEFPVPTANSCPYRIGAGPDGALWFTEQQGNQIGRIPTSATVANPQITEFAVPTSNSRLQDIAAGPDGALWFAEFDAAKIGRITTAGTVTEPPIGAAAGDLAGGPNELWITDLDKTRLSGGSTTAEYSPRMCRPRAAGPGVSASGPTAQRGSLKGTPTRSAGLRPPAS
jgi:streptogramin lyase